MVLKVHPQLRSLVVATVVTALMTAVYGQNAIDRPVSGSIGNTFTRLTASYNLGDPGWTTWRNTSTAEFNQVLLPQFQAARPSTTATWVQASTADLKYNLKMTFSGIIPKAVKIDTLFWELAKPLAAVFPGAADVQFSVNGSALNTNTSVASVRLSVTYSSYPPAGTPYTLNATGMIRQMQGLLANKNVSGVSVNAATFINNITGIQLQTLWRITNATLSYVVPSATTYLPSGNQELYYTFIPLQNDLQMTGGVSNVPDNGISPAPTTSLYDKYNPQSPAPTNMLANGTNVTYSNTTNTTASNTSSPPSGGTFGAPASWELLALVYEDVSSFFVGRQTPFNVPSMACAATRDTCCRNCDPTKSCVKKPLCVPKDLTLTIEEQICLAPIGVSCWQRSYGCGNYYQDLAPAADQMYQYYRGFWDFSWNQYWNKIWGQGGQNFYSDQNCAPWRLISCFQAPTPEQCSGMCTVMDQAICSRDDCTTWDPVRKATATCVWDNASQSCRLQRVDNCTSQSLSVSDKVVCRISNIMNANAGRNLTDVATDLCSSTVANLCSVASSPACSYCQLIQGKLAPAMTAASEEARYCGANGDPSPYYNSTGLRRNQGQLLKTALTLLLNSSVMCDAVADAFSPSAGTPLLSSSNLQSHGGAWICCKTAMAAQLCDTGGSAVVGPQTTATAAANIGNVTGSIGTTINSTLDAGRDCSRCGSYLEEFAMVAGTLNYTKVNVSSFCMIKEMQQYQAALAAGRPDEFVSDVCTTEWDKNQWCNPEYGCAHKRQCVSSDPSVSMQNLACTTLSANATTCNQKAGCVFVPSSKDDYWQQCARVAYIVRQYGTWQLTNPTNLCHMGMGNLPATCGNACQSKGYCNTTGAGDPQCVQACSKCNKCIAAVQYAAQALNLSDTSWNMYGYYSQPNPLAGQIAYKACMSQALGGSNIADAGSIGTTTSGQCMAPGSALCGVFQQVNNGWCDQSSGCQSVESCKRFDTSACDPTASDWTGMACKVNRACERLLGAPQPLPAATLCGPEYLNACAVNNTSFECAKCLNDADDLQSRLRTLPRFKCRNLYDPIQTQECLKYFIGWSSAKTNCPAVPKLFDRFEQVNNANVTSYNSWTWYDWNVQPYSDFCWNLQAANNNGGNPVGVSPGYPPSPSSPSPPPSPEPTLAPSNGSASANTATNTTGVNTTTFPGLSPKLPLAPANSNASINTSTNSTNTTASSIQSPKPPPSASNPTSNIIGSSNATNATTLPKPGPSPPPPPAITNASATNATGRRHLQETIAGGNITAASSTAPTNASNANYSSPPAASNHTMPPSQAPTNNTSAGNGSYIDSTVHSNGTYANGSSGGNDMYTAGTPGSNTPGSNTPYTNGSVNFNGMGYPTGSNGSQGSSDSGLANQDSAWSGPAPPCQACIKSPAWVHDILRANSSTVCVTTDSTQYCRLSQGDIVCNQGKPAPDCSPVVQCVEDKLRSCLEPLQRPELQMLPLLQLKTDTNQLDWSAGNNNTQFNYASFLPLEAVMAAEMLVHLNASYLATPALPLGFGCPNWPPVMSVMQELGMTNGFNQSTMPELAKMDSMNSSTNSSMDMTSSSSNTTGSIHSSSNMTSSSTNSSTDLTAGNSNMSNSSSNVIQGVPQSSLCWVDAAVAMNLMVGSLLEAIFNSSNEWISQGGGQSVNVPYSSVNSWTVYWMPPNLPCPSPGTPGCLNRTFTFQLETWVPCNSVAGPFKPTFMGAQKVVPLDSGAVNSTNGTDNSTAYCLYDFRSPPGIHLSSYDYNTATFAPSGPLGSIIRAPPCNTSNTDNQTEAVMCQGPPMYPISADGLPEALFAEPLSSYDVVKVQGVLRRTTNLQAGYSQLPWCPPAVEPCSMNYVPGVVDNGTSTGSGWYNQTGSGYYSPPLYYSPPPNYEPWFDSNSNAPEGYFQYSPNAAGSQTTQYTYVTWAPPYQYDYMAQENQWFYTSSSGQSWNDIWQCNYVVRFAARAMKGGYISETPAGLYGACVDYATSRGNPAYQQMMWSGQNNCNSWADSCCPDVGLKPGNKEVCEAQSSCSFSASCTLATVQRASGTIVADDCYSQFWDSLYNITSATYATCDPSCSFQPLGWTSGDATIRALPTARTAADGSTSLQQGICYNKTAWDTCTGKTTEATCHSWANGNNVCSWAPTCKPPTAADFNCLSSTDSCCMDSSSATFTQDQGTTCTAQTGANNRPCKVDKQCYLLIDPCKAKVTPWDCLADATCQFTPTYDAKMGGTCISQQASDPCAGLAASACSSTVACALADRCVTDRCLGPTDNCCALSGKDAACRADPTCMVTSVCLPVADECAMYSNATMCQDSGPSFCLWQDLSSGPGPESAYNNTNMTVNTNTSDNATATGSGVSTATATDCNSSSAACNTSTPAPSPAPGSSPTPAQYIEATSGVCVMDESKHPCSQATDLQSCSNQLDSLGRHRCYSQGNCLSACSQCASCISQITSSFEPGLANLATNNSIKVSQNFSTWCYGMNVDRAICDTVTTAIIHSPQGNLARRPGMMCTMAGQCPKACRIPITDVNGTIIRREAVDMCTDSGTVSGTPVPVPVQSGSTCLADSDCTTNGAWCDLGVAATQVCRCVAGLDVCNIVGRCNSDQCPRLTSLTTVNRDLTSCSQDSTCGTGFVCQLTLYQTYNCSNSVVTPTNHNGYCIEAAPSIISAKLDENAASITVSLSVAASGFTTSCSAIFSDNTAAKLGSSAICSVDPDQPDLKQMSILLQNAPAIAWDVDKLELRKNQAVLVSNKGGRSFAGNTTGAVAKCVQCPAPVAILAGPLLITKPCPGSNAADFNPVYFDASRSVGTAAAPVTDVTWELVKGQSTAVSSALSGLSAATSARDKMVLKLDGAALQSTTADTYALAITVTNSLGQSSSAVTQFTVAEAGASPSITVFAPGSDASGSVSVQPSRGLKLYSKLQIDSVCKGVATKVNYHWTCSASDGSACTLPTDAAAFNQLLLSPSDLAVFKLDTDYTFILAAGFTGSATPTTARAVVRFTRSPLRAMLSGPNGDVPATKNFTLDASSSSDPDNPAASLRYDFTCAPQPCFTDLAYTGVRPTQSSWNIAASKFAGVSQPYILTVTVSATGAGDARQASTSVTVTPKPGNPPTGAVSRFCGYDASSAPLQCPARHSPSQDLVVTLTPDPDFSAASVQWAMGDQQLQESADVKEVTKYTLTVRPSALSTAGTVKLRAIMSLPGAGSGAASIDVRLNTPPNCPQPPCFFTDINSTVFPAYTFVGTASGWQDADGDVITYEFGQVSGANYQASQPAGPSSSYTFRGFTPGNYSLDACALDTSAGRTCATAPIQVLPPGVLQAEQKSALVENSIGKIDVSQLAISGDVSAVTDAMQEVASLAAFSTSPSLVNKTNDLLTTLPAVMNSKDPAAMASSLNAADKVSDAGSAALSGKAGSALLDIVDAFVSANTAGAGASDDQVKTASKVLGKGVAAAKPKSTAPKGRRRALLATDTTSSTAYTRLANGMNGLVALMSASTPIGGAKTIGASDMCMGVARDNGAGGALDSKQLTLDCSGASTTAAAPASGHKRRALLTAAPGTASVTMGAGFSTACSADSTCRSGSTVVSQTYVTDPATTLDQVAAWPDSSLVSNASNSTQLSAISGVLNFGLGSRATGPICSTGNCTATLSVPVAGYDPTLNTTCLRLDPGGTGGLAATSVGIAAVPDSSSSSSTSTVKCTTSQLGQVVVVQYRATAAAVTEVINSTSTSANVTTTNSTAATNTSSGSTQQSPAPAYAGVDNSTLSASDLGEPVDFSFRFGTFDYNSMFKTPAGDINNTALEGFKQLVQESFLAGVAQQSKMTVKTQDNKLQLNRVTVKDVRPGSVVTDLEFRPPASATAADISGLKATVTSTASAFFSAPAFTARYGTPAVTGKVLETSNGQGPSYALPVGLGVGLGAGVMLLIVAITLLAARRRRAKQLTVVDPEGIGGGGALGARGMHSARGGDSMSHVA